MAQVGARPAGAEGGERPAAFGDCGMADGVDPAVEDVQPPGPSAAVDGVARQSESNQLGAIHDTLAPRRELREPPIDVNVTPARRRMTLTGVSAVNVAAIGRRVTLAGDTAVNVTAIRQRVTLAGDTAVNVAAIRQRVTLAGVHARHHHLAR